MSFQGTALFPSSVSDRPLHETGVGLVGGVLKVVGTNSRDVVTFSEVGKNIKVLARLGGKMTTQFHAFSAVKSIQVFGQGGDDLIRNDTRRISVIRGGVGNDSLFGGSANDMLYGDAGNDKGYGREGRDVLHGGSGNDLLEGDDVNQYDRFSDKVFGDAGVDTLYGTFSLDSLNGGGQGNDRACTRFFVDSTADSDNAKFTDGNLTFREAVKRADRDDIISFGKLTAGGAKTIKITKGTFTIDESISIQGVGNANRLTIDGSENAGRLFNITGGASVVVRNLTIRRFDAGDANGGAIAVDHGNLKLSNIVGTQNKTTGLGGFLYLESFLNPVSAILTQSTLSSNRANWGGAIQSHGASLMIDRSTLDSNRAVSGGALDTVLPTGRTRIYRSTLSNNTATDSGGGISFWGGAMAIENSTISNNTSATKGAGITASLDADTDLIITNSTIAFNKATTAGAGLDISGANQGVINNTIIYGNKNRGASLDFSLATGIAENQSFNNWIGVRTNTTFLSGVGGNRVGTLAGFISTLADNGGPTKTHKLVAGSKAINAGNNSKAVNWLNATLAVDQTGRARKVGGRVDIGAFEFQA